MTAPGEPRIVVEVGGLAVAEQGPLVLLVDRETGALATLAFGLGVLALVFGGFGAVTLILAATRHQTPPWWIGAMFLLVGVSFAGGVFAVVGRVRSARTRPLTSYRPVAVFDRAGRVYLDADGAVVAALDRIVFRTHMQVASSSPALVVDSPAGTRILKRGNPFNGGLGDLQAILTDLLFGHPR